MPTQRKCLEEVLPGQDEDKMVDQRETKMKNKRCLMSLALVVVLVTTVSLAHLLQISVDGSTAYAAARNFLPTCQQTTLALVDQAAVPGMFYTTNLTRLPYLEGLEATFQQIVPSLMEGFLSRLVMEMKQTVA